MNGQGALTTPLSKVGALWVMRPNCDTFRKYDADTFDRGRR
jgi:hypothetical protein